MLCCSLFSCAEVGVVLLVLVLSTLLRMCDSEILFKHCLGPADIGDLWKIGVYPNVCIKNHEFKGETHAWSIRNSVVKNTTFTSCKFQKNRDRDVDFNGTRWEMVRFKECEFGGNGEESVMAFRHSSMQRVLFDGCIFHRDAMVLFERFSLENSEFRNCTFESDTVASLGFLRNFLVNGSRFFSWSSNGRVEQSGAGSITFSQVSGNGVRFYNCSSEGTIRFQDASISKFEVEDSEIGALACHEEAIAGREAKRKCEFEDTFIRNVSVSDGMYCDETKFSGLHIQDVRVGNKVNLCRSEIEKLVVVNVGSLSNETSSEFALCEAEVRGKIIEKMATTKATFADTLFGEAIRLVNFSVAKTNVNLNKAVFTQEQINDECCTVSCVSQGCKCDVSTEPLFCPRGNSSVNINVKDACFPGGATVSVVQGDGSLQTTRMRDLQHGDVVVDGDGGNGASTASAVIFFGHRSGRYARYRALTWVTGTGPSAARTLEVSGNHLLRTASGGLVAARLVRVGDALVTGSGARATVVGARGRVRSGMYAPATASGALVVDGVQASCYTDAVSARVAHALLAPVRFGFAAGGGGRAVRGLGALHMRSYAWVARAARRALGDARAWA